MQPASLTHGTHFQHALLAGTIHPRAGPALHAAGFPKADEQQKMLESNAPS